MALSVWFKPMKNGICVTCKSILSRIFEIKEEKKNVKKSEKEKNGSRMHFSV